MRHGSETRRTAPAGWAGLLATAALASAPAMAAEGGGSLYLQGFYNDFAMARPLAPGLHVRNDVLHYRGERAPADIAPGVQASARQEAWGDMLKVAWASDLRFLGGTYSAAAVLPMAPRVRVDTRVEGPGFSQSATAAEKGLGDLFVVPFRLTWELAPDHHVTASTNVALPTGKYEAGRLINLGRNHWAVDPNLAYTWLDSRRGHEVSATAGMFINARNRATRYRSGNEFHLDWLVGQHLSARAAVAVVGYVYRQTTDDHCEDPAAKVAGRARATGVGVATMGSLSVGGTPVHVIAKWVRDVSVTERMDGDAFILSAAVSF